MKKKILLSVVLLVLLLISTLCTIVTSSLTFIPKDLVINTGTDVIGIMYYDNFYIKANKITPSNPRHFANGSKNSDITFKSEASPTVTLAQTQIISPAGIAEITARPSTKSVRSKTERVSVLTISGRR